MIRKNSLLFIAKSVQVSTRRPFFTSPLLYPLHTTIHQGSSSLTLTTTLLLKDFTNSRGSKSISRVDH